MAGITPRLLVVEVEERTVDVAVRRLSSALIDAGGDGEALIETVRGVGYRFLTA